MGVARNEYSLKNKSEAATEGNLAIMITFY